MADNGNGNGNGAAWGSLEPLVRVIRDVGFPVVVAGYLLSQIPPIQRALDGFHQWAQGQQKLSEAQTDTLREITRELREHRMYSERLAGERPIPELRAGAPR